MVSGLFSKCTDQARQNSDKSLVKFMPMAPREETLLTRYFRSKSTDLRSGSQAVLAPHSGLRGSHREQLCREFLVDFLPRRYSVGRGIIFDSLGHTSRESDVVIWDDQNFPRLPEKGHTLFFADSVKCVVEVKSRWSTADWTDTLVKTSAVRKLLPTPNAMIGLSDRVAALEYQVGAMLHGRAMTDLVLTRHHIAYAAVFLDGGDRCTADQLRALVSDVDECLPDLTLLLEPGICIEKMVVEDEKGLRGWAGIRRLLEDALLGFALKLLQSVHSRSGHLDNPMIFHEAYDLDLDRPPTEGFAYEFTRMHPTSYPFFVRFDSGSPDSSS